MHFVVFVLIIKLMIGPSFPQDRIDSFYYLSYLGDLEWENLIPLNCKIFGFTSAEVISSIMEQLEMSKTICHLIMKTFCHLDILRK